MSHNHVVYRTTNIPSPEAEGRSIHGILSNLLAGLLDGEACVKQLKEWNFYWSHPEWPGFYIEEAGRRELIRRMGGGIGPTFGRTTYDYQNNFVWDLKTHSVTDKNGNTNEIIPLNDAASIEDVANQFKGIGFVIAMCDMHFDYDRSFQKWQDELKGGLSDYEKERIRRGAPSRIRKRSCEVRHWWVLFFPKAADFRRGLTEGWVSTFQKDWRNADGSLRNTKYRLHQNGIPSEYFIARF